MRIIDSRQQTLIHAGGHILKLILPRHFVDTPEYNSEYCHSQREHRQSKKETQLIISIIIGLFLPFIVRQPEKVLPLYHSIAQRPEIAPELEIEIAEFKTGLLENPARNLPLYHFQGLLQFDGLYFVLIDQH